MTTFSHQQWNLPPKNVQLSGHDVHVWRASLQQPADVVNRLERYLNPEELARAARFYFEKDRAHFIVAHGLLRLLLGDYLNIAPAQLQFQYNDYGKPSLDFPSSAQPLNFNLSHSHELALYAFTWTREIGVDVEYMRLDILYEDVARHSFSAYENSMLCELSSEEKQQGFFNCWTRKEAYIKARGKGLSMDLSMFDVSLKPGEHPVLLQSRENPDETMRWVFHQLFADPEYAAALVVEGNGRELSRWQWEYETHHGI